ncbi:RsbT co-antagonist protein RsbRA [Peribacillus castrilensis]|jgi:rsbT co-antagonist protein RsbR|uniref:Positive regulator of sigma-B activity n=3 Tax=Peribacillus TaxID=2675229 RepID=A0AA90ST89_9BACI|nr:MULTISPECIES: RsbT co-antagonist protein RsbRA [Bacillaceae]KOR81471.1 RsbR protein [Bacillus sp. FJAT-21352]MBD8138718.1 STAS domain-containing protein [Bacillus sp. CFBP 13597]MBL3645602.1 STAS domain-containing protein [Bacillus sp. RHFB]MCD1163741.1 STAS domain-containing protein [Peribacillus castrilensis]MCP1097114.1 STAS domain-containing protein [Bacillaceae bacterium OS4b]PEF38861.1 RsbR protein [Bacillus sp. AFS094228]PEO50093.1 RsbR protein [Bacillus sp. AFS026049]QYF82884.1 S
MNQLVYDFIKQNQDYILTEWMGIMKESTDERLIKVVSDRMFTQTSSEFIDMIITNVDSKNKEFTLKLSDFAEKVVQLGWPLTFVNEGLHKFTLIVINGMVEKGLVTPDNQVNLVNHLDKWATPINNEIVNIYTQTWERTVSMQKIALQELSAPLIPVLEGITVMPLIGTIDTERAKQIMENLLTGVVKHRSEVVLIDITGVPVVDTMVAHHIIQAAEAVRLVGAKCILCGIRPEIAQTIVNLGINLNEVITKNTLKKGIEVALELTSRKIVKVEG